MIPVYFEDDAGKFLAINLPKGATKHDEVWFERDRLDDALAWARTRDPYVALHFGWSHYSVGKKRLTQIPEYDSVAQDQLAAHLRGWTPPPKEEEDDDVEQA